MGEMGGGVRVRQARGVRGRLFGSPARPGAAALTRFPALAVLCNSPSRRFSTLWGDKGYMHLRADCPENRGAMSMYRDKYITLPVPE
jgi:hypothetical protein